MGMFDADEIMNDPLRFGKHTGKTPNQLMKTEEGRSWLMWYIEKKTESTNPKFAQIDERKRTVYREAMVAWSKANKPSDAIKPKFGNDEPTQPTHVSAPTTGEVSVLSFIKADVAAIKGNTEKHRQKIALLEKQVNELIRAMKSLYPGYDDNQEETLIQKEPKSDEPVQW